MINFAVCTTDDFFSLDKGKMYEILDYGNSLGIPWYKVRDNTGTVQKYSTKYFKEEDMSKAEEAKVLVQGRKFIVGSFDSEGNFSIASEPKGHATEPLAKKEAQRLAHNDLSKTFVVMQMRYGAKAATITEI